MGCNRQNLQLGPHWAQASSRQWALGPPRRGTCPAPTDNDIASVPLVCPSSRIFCEPDESESDAVQLRLKCSSGTQSCSVVPSHFPRNFAFEFSPVASTQASAAAVHSPKSRRLLFAATKPAPSQQQWPPRCLPASQSLRFPGYPRARSGTQPSPLVSSWFPEHASAHSAKKQPPISPH